MSEVPGGILRDFDRRYPTAWRYVNCMRQENEDNPLWDDFCFSSSEELLTCFRAALADSCRAHNIHHEEWMDSTDYSMFCVLAPWRYTKSVFTVHESLCTALRDTPLSGELPVDVLTHLPYWCIYVAVPDSPPEELVGFFAQIIPLEGENHINIVCIRQMGETRMFFPYIFPLNCKTVQELYDDFRGRLHAHVVESILIEDSENIKLCFSILLYICSQEPDISPDDPREARLYPPVRYTKTKRGWKIIPPHTIRHYHVGHRIAHALSGNDTIASGGRRAHIRKAHWHLYHTGKGRTIPQYRWLYPMLISSTPVVQDQQQDL